MRRILLTIGMLAVLASLAQAQNGTGKQVEQDLDHSRSGVITLKQLKDNLQTLVTFSRDVAIHFVLPTGWETVEETVDPATGKQRDDVTVYALLSRAPVADPQQPTDLIFELDVYQKGLLDDLPPDLPLEERTVGVQLWNFLNEQDSINRRAGMKLKTDKRDLEPKPYGSSKGREAEYFVPLFYETPTGAMLYTFTSFTGETVWMVKFLVAEDQTDNYGALIALVMDNTFGMTLEQFEEFTKAREALEQQQ